MKTLVSLVKLHAKTKTTKTSKTKKTNKSKTKKKIVSKTASKTVLTGVLARTEGKSHKQLKSVI